MYILISRATWVHQIIEIERAFLWVFEKFLHQEPWYMANLVQKSNAAGLILKIWIVHGIDLMNIGHRHNDAISDNGSIRAVELTSKLMSNVQSTVISSWILIMSYGTGVID